MSRLTFVALLALGCHPMSERPLRELDTRANDPATLPVVEVWLGQAISKIKGKAWLVYPDGRVSDITAVNDPSRVTVHLPSGRTFTTWSSTVFLEHKQGLVSLVSLQPVSGYKPFAKAVAETERLMNELKLEENPKSSLPFSKWKSQQPIEDRPIDLFAVGRVAKGIAGRVEIKFNPDHQGWRMVVRLLAPKLYGGSDDDFVEKD